MNIFDMELLMKQQEKFLFTELVWENHMITSFPNVVIYCIAFLGMSVFQFTSEFKTDVDIRIWE